MKNNVSIIVGGSGQYGITLAEKLIKNKEVLITTRSVKKCKEKFRHIKKIKIYKLDVQNKKKIEKLLLKVKPKEIYYFAGQSSPAVSFKKPGETYISNYLGCKNFLEVIYKTKIKCKFLNASSCEIYGNSNNILNINSKKNPVSPYAKSKLASFNLTKYYRENKNLSTYNAIIFNTESIYRDKHYLISKICLSAINAKKSGRKTAFGNLNISREWNWCPEQCNMILKFIKKSPQDFILSNGKNYSAFEMLKFAFKYFKLDYRNFIYFDKKYSRKRDIKNIRSNFKKCLKRNNLKRNTLVYGKLLVNKLIRYYLTI